MTTAALVCLEPEIGSHSDVTSPLPYSIETILCLVICYDVIIEHCT